MSVSRRAFLGSALATGASCRAASSFGLWQDTSQETATVPEGRFDPWIEVIPENLHFNTARVTELTEGTPILAVIKNNAYGLGMVETARVLEPLPEIAGFAVVKAEAALALREAGIRKRVLLMGMCSNEEGRELVARDVELSVYTDYMSWGMWRILLLASRAEGPIPVQLYLDTGLGRMGMPYHKALPWIESLSRNEKIEVRGTFMAFTEEAEFDREQLARFRQVIEEARAADLPLGDLHAASSNGVFHLREARFDLVRPGIALFGGYPSRPEEERQKAELRAAVRLRARVVRVVQLRPGDGAGYGRNYVAERPTWLATVPAGHVDGVPRQAVNGGRVLIKGRTFPIVGSVSASHCLVELTSNQDARIGDEVTIIGPDHPDIDPNAIAAATGVSVYDVFMHLSPTLPRYVV